jgi:hypothetical protein
MKCDLCGQKISRHNDGFSDLLNNEEQKRLLNLKKGRTICLDCKFTVMALDIISPF